MKEKVLLRISECCYRLENVNKGYEYLDQLENLIKPRQIYTISLLRGKFNDLLKKFEEAAKDYQDSMNIYVHDFNEESRDP